MEAIVAIIGGTLFIPGAVVTMILLLRRMEHLERLKMIETGTDMSKLISPKRLSNGGAIKLAFTAIGIGLGILIGNILDTHSSLDPESIYFATCLITGGAGLFFGHWLAEKTLNKKKSS